ncbi:MAG: hypothetical protein QGF80_05375 [Pelagibacteraceae bacterium]|jgi:hypothetical protein|nr:hypothetical protein [Candidatus Pelagibacter sp.]MDP6681151.1 hypothetical protein [Pelagibacteraceae bacterium]MDP6710451.1 hypothetical protein [Pelagibacteraceae bacterium]|tara:strand:- start:563 stop:1240 length:678 start_codon:yes stop_codon:yes gene_type:complete
MEDSLLQKTDGSLNGSLLLGKVSENLRKFTSNHEPFKHWLFDGVLSEETIDELLKLPLPVPKIEKHTGKRESQNQTRVFLNKECCNKHSVAKNVTNVFNHPSIISKLSNICGRDLTKGKLRIEYTLDTGDFWLEPHLDIKEKLVTFLIYLSKDPGSSEWGTTIYNRDLSFHSKAPYKSNMGLMFMAGEDTWHGVPKQNIQGIRKNLIINFVTKDWKSINELAPNN